MDRLKNLDTEHLLSEMLHAYRKCIQVNCKRSREVFLQYKNEVMWRLGGKNGLQRTDEVVKTEVA